MARIFCIANQKGGVGKTTTCVNLAAGLATAGQRVLLVDLDPQGNATMGCGIDKRSLSKSIYHLLVGLCTVAEARVRSESGGFDVIPANRDLAGAEVELVGLDRRENRLRDALALHQSEYDFVLIDCPPSLSLLTLNGRAYQAKHPHAPHPFTNGVHDRVQWPAPYTCDFVFVSDDLAPRLRAVRVDGDTQASDHQPVLVELA